MQLKTVVLCCALSTLVGCSGNSDEEKKAGIEKKPADNHYAVTLEEYIQTKKIPDTAKDRQLSTYKSFQERSAIAERILDEKLGDYPTTKVAYLENKNKTVINDYLDRFLADKLSDENLEQFYLANKARFEKHEYLVEQLVLRTGTSALEDNAWQQAERISSDPNDNETLQALAKKHVGASATVANVNMTSANVKSNVFQVISGLSLIHI